MEQSISSAARVEVDCGTLAGIQVPVGDICSMAVVASRLGTSKCRGAPAKLKYADPAYGRTGEGSVAD